MDPVLLAMLVDGAVFLLFVVGVVWLLKRLRRRATEGRASDGLAIPPSGGWTELAARFATDLPPPRLLAERVSVMVGPVAWKNCVAVGVGPDALFLAVEVPLLGAMGKRPLKIPWSEIGDGGPTTLYWKAARLLVVGRPTLATVTLPGALRDELVRLGHLAG